MPKAYSLHIGLNEVDAQHYCGWEGKLFCSENDALFYQQVAAKAGITDRRLLLSSRTAGAEMPTSANLDKYLTEYSQALTEGDFLFISYSGHGGQIEDMNYDETDFQDETWCLFDRQYIDDELWLHFSKFAKGVRIFVISDSCHSGSVTRVITSDKDREVEGRISDIFKNMKLVTRNAPKEVTFPTYQANKAQYAAATRLPVVAKEEINASVLLLGACQDEEKAAEWEGFGLFTSTIRKVLMENEFVGTYEELYKKVCKLIPSIQQPNIFAYGAGAELFRKEQILQVDPGKHFSLFDPSKNKPATTSSDENLIVHIEDGSLKTKAAYKPASIATRDASATPEAFIKDIAPETSKAWDEAYKEYFNLKKEGETKAFVEPNIKSKYLKETPRETRSTGLEKDDYMSGWPRPATNLGADEFVWHIGEQHSQLKKAAERVQKAADELKQLNATDQRKYNPLIRIAHIDTGYVPSHPSTPANLLRGEGISFVSGEENNKGEDIFQNKMKMLEQDGHGSATLAILAGNYINKADSYAEYEGFFGGIPFAEVLPVRICDTVYNAFNANDVARGIEYAIEKGCEVITMSMAGYPTRRVAKAVNKAYEAGVVIVTAAGNNWVKGISKLTPKALMYPARFDRVIAACGVCYNEAPYDFEANQEEMKLRSEGGDTMQGNWGPEQAMQTALAAYTPNLAWANNNPNKPYRFTRTGGGTSSATPQIAAAAALWILFNRKKLVDKGFAGTWKQAEAARQALFQSGGRDYPGYKKYYGNGSLKASNALDISDDILASDLKEAKAASTNFLGIGMFIKQWFRAMPAGSVGDISFTADDQQLNEMLELELLQVMYKEPALFDYLDQLDLDGTDKDFFKNASAREKFIQKVKASEYASDTLKALL